MTAMIFVVAAFICFLLAAIGGLLFAALGIEGKVNLVAIGLACLSLSFILQNYWK